MEEKSYLEALIKKYQYVIDTLGKQVDDAKNKLNIAQSALHLLQEEDIITKQNSFFKIPPEKVSDKYAKTNLRATIRDVLVSHPEEYLNGQEIYDELIKNGFHSGSKNIKRDVYTALNYLRKQKGEEIIFIEEGGRKKYTIKKEK
jgi:hypothetical protein